MGIKNSMKGVALVAAVACAAYLAGAFASVWAQRAAYGGSARQTRAVDPGVNQPGAVGNRGASIRVSINPVPWETRAAVWIRESISRGPLATRRPSTLESISPVPPVTAGTDGDYFLPGSFFTRSCTASRISALRCASVLL